MTTTGADMPLSLRFARMLAIVVFVGIAVYLAPLDPCILKLQFAFDEETFRDILTQWQTEGIARYQSHIPADFLFLFLYGLAGYWFGRECSGKEREPALLLTWSLPLAAMADAVEDVLHLILTAENTTAMPELYFLSGSAASFKWLGIAIFILSWISYCWKTRAFVRRSGRSR